MFKFFLTLITCSGVILIMPLQAFSQQFETNLLTPQNTESQLYNQAYAITVKVISGQNWGSGIIVNKQGQTYTILTNRHVLTASDDHQIQTFDGQIYNPSIVNNFQINGEDLALLQFQSSRNYQIATIANSANLRIGETIFAVGFPLLTEDYNSNNQGFVFTQGQIELILNQPLEEGYQIGYTNNINKGMSGGAILNAQGQLIGINGRHAYPLWGDPFIYENGSKPSPELREQMIPISWGIPSNTFIPLLGLSQITNENMALSTPILNQNINQIESNLSNTLERENSYNSVFPNQLLEQNINQNYSTFDLFMPLEREVKKPYSQPLEYLW